ncbi:hypothetical protein Acor_18470 [Acrocarpospora corrugata]|uniref:DUF5666 domain-containing protein n=1 Tax=Acrocarpospora corrugata TaxID=35763 RepID=A0A5M3VTE3_9ACTN|nr:hypothetical protein [Acrocarpospora corrugata]GER99783.1 hypothetical protein Acor_18470 [Acrocarpospora corrugata]
MTDPEFKPAEELAYEPVRRPKRRALVAGVATALLVVGGVGVAAAASSPTPSGSESPTAVPSGEPSPGLPPGKPGPGHKGGWGPLRGGMFGALHGEFVVPKEGGGYETVSMQSGKVTAVDQSSVTVRSEDGFSRTYSIADTTRVDGGREGIGSVKVDDDVTVLATVADGKATATMLINATRPARPGWFDQRGGNREWKIGPEELQRGDRFPRRIPMNPDELKPIPSPPDSPIPESATPTPTA